MNQKSPTQLQPPTNDFTVLLSPTPRGARLARLLATDWLRARNLPHPVPETAEHLIAELAANAATHGRFPGRDFRLALLVDAATLRIEVTDTRGDDLPHRRVPGPEDESGRGLLLIEALADRWGVERGPFPRKTVWAELDLAKRRPAETSLAPEPGRPCSGGADDLPQEAPGEKGTEPDPTPPAHGSNSLGRVNIPNWIG
ncbi:ATP-binding protein [Streptomyces sp. NPDC086091]|uniref:ATP-binding protein n=1 Tax=Streptomyces sp. NPDC086091 TaxID=3365751 RepID=UPI00382E6FD4